MSIFTPATWPTPYPEVNALLDALLDGVRAVLGAHLVGAYLFGSLTTGDFDQDSDIDALVVMDEDVSEEQFAALAAMHERIARIESPWAIQLEVAHLSQRALRRYDPADATLAHIERGEGERLHWAPHDSSWLVQRAALRTHGITLAGPTPQTLIDPVSPDDLRQAMRGLLNGWISDLLRNPAQIDHWGYQSYIVLSLCRILYTLRTGEIASKPAASRWALGVLDARWRPLIERAWLGRSSPGDPAPPGDVDATLDFARYCLELAQQSEERDAARMG